MKYYLLILILNYIIVLGYKVKELNHSYIHTILNKMIENEENIEEIFRTYHQLYNKQEKYFLDSEQAKQRLSAFKDSLSFIKHSNSLNTTYTLGLTAFADMTQEEYISTLDSSLHERLENNKLLYTE